MSTHHPPIVTRRDEGGVQRGLPGVMPEEAPLPSEQVLSGELLNERHREALGKMREHLGECPEGFEHSEWRVAAALLSPPAVETGGVGHRNNRARIARECFPGRSTPAALRAFLDASVRPHVVQFVNDFRALEMLDVFAQRALWRDRLDLAGAFLAERMRPPKGMTMQEHVSAMEPSDAAKLSAAMAAVSKSAMDLDGLRAPKPALSMSDDDAEAKRTSAGNGGPSPDLQRALAEKVDRTMADLQARRRTGE